MFESRPGSQRFCSSRRFNKRHRTLDTNKTWSAWYRAQLRRPTLQHVQNPNRFLTGSPYHSPRMAVFIQIPENPNCAAMDGQVFECRTPSRPVAQVRIAHNGPNDWWDITGIDDGGNPCPAAACLIEDSGEGACYLVTGGAWGLRLKRTSLATAWSLANGEQWGESLLLLGGDGADLRFLDERR